MANSEKCTWVGDSGTEYTYFIRALPVNFDPNQNGNYIFSKKNERGKWVPIYIGEGDLADMLSIRLQTERKQTSRNRTPCSSFPIPSPTRQTFRRRLPLSDFLRLLSCCYCFLAWPCGCCPHHSADEFSASSLAACGRSP